MPELAEVAYYRARWDPGLGGKITRVHLHPASRIFRSVQDPELHLAALAGRTLTSTQSHGKNLLFQFSGGHWLTGHLGMTGALSAESPNYLPTKHDHLVLFQSRHALVFSDPRMFGRITHHQGKIPPPEWIALPPEILSPSFTKARLAEALTRRARTPIKPLLLDQEYFPGIGNWMADEILWRTKIHPATLSGDLLNRAAELRAATCKLTRQSLKIIAPDWLTPPESWLFNHRWQNGGHCPRCQCPLTRETLRGRTTCTCPKCQYPPSQIRPPIASSLPLPHPQNRPEN